MMSALAKPSAARELGTILQPASALSRSQLYALQRAFYAEAGLTPWSQGTVPSQVTTNPVMAAAYARVIVGHLRDLWQAGGLDVSQPLYVLDLGAGTGRLTYLLREQLRALLASGALPQVEFRYVLVDVGDAHLPLHASHPRLGPLLSAGVLDCASLPAEYAAAPPALQLLRSRTLLTPQQLRNPPIVLCNYFFDSIPNDAFRVKNGQLQECRVTLRMPAAEAPDPSDPALLDRLHVQLDYRPLAADGAYYTEPLWNEQLAAYARALPDTHFLFPVGPLRCLRWLAELGGERLLLLAADKGYDHIEQIHGYQNLALTQHGSFSLPVNFHALAAVATGYTVLRGPRRESQLKILGLCRGSAPAWPETALAFADHIARSHPSDRHCILSSAVMPAMEQPLGYLLSLLRLSEYDPWFVLKYQETFAAEVGLAPPALLPELCADLARVWANYFPLGDRQDLPGALARILRRAGCPEDAARYTKRAVPAP
jgi:hypothetical protein